jgi:DNA-directed RNA polymerase specialized sigma24 family protein
MSAAPATVAETDPERSAARLEMRTLLEDAIDALPESFRVVFIVREVEDMSIEETGGVAQDSAENGQDAVAPRASPGSGIFG